VAGQQQVMHDGGPHHGDNRTGPVLRRHAPACLNQTSPDQFSRTTR
jgi:hypothetical protein